MPLFRKVLIANRGEIAVRITHACRQVGIPTVAVYSEADQLALHVQLADEAYLIGPAPATESYLNIDSILAAAAASGADAVHPGYGFLAENSEFARAVAARGLTWIGPSADVIALMGDKVAAKELARSVGVPVVPGYQGEDQAIEAFAVAAESIGYPVMVKAAAGGGGRGMRSVATPDQLAQSIEGAKREARAAFGDDRVFLEKLIEKPRHVEIQVMLDGHGEGVYLGERDCSLQRRHQKIVEESPCPVMARELREEMGEAAVKLARAAGYVNAGTVEFLFGADSFYFLEMNTRIQVEHPVTEAVTGLDLVSLQLKVAAGEALPISQLDVALHGHAIEARIYAEDPVSGFLPATGKVEVFRPPEGPGIRNDVGVYQDFEVDRFYDPLLAKLVVHGGNRAEAVARLCDALEDYGLLGPKNNVEFLYWVASHPDFINGHVDITWVERNWKPPDSERPSLEVLAAAALFHIISTPGVEPGSGGEPYSPWTQTNSWANGFMRTLELSDGQAIYRVVASRQANTAWLIRAGGEEQLFRPLLPSRRLLVLESGNRVSRYYATSDGRVTQLLRGSKSWQFTLGNQVDQRTASSSGHARQGTTVPMPGTIVKVAVVEGQHVAEHEPLVVLEAMKMEHVVPAPHSGVVTSVLVKEGDLVAAGQPVAELETD